MANDTVSDLLSHLNKRKDTPPARTGTDLTLESNVPFGVPTLIPELDLSLNRPGYPAGRIVELYGFEATGKTTAAYHAIAACQRIGGVALFIDTEFSFSAKRAAECGVNPDNLTVLNATNIEEIFDHMSAFIEWLEKKDWKNASVIAVDSITGVQTKDESEKGFDAAYKIGADARAIRSGLRKLNARIAESKTIAIFVNHAISKVNAMFGGRNSESAGGHALKFFSSVRVNFNFVQNLFDGKEDKRTRRGQVVSIGVEKNKVASTGKPNFKVELTSNGFDLYEGLLNAMLTAGCVERVTTQSYLFKPDEYQFTKPKWASFVDGKGGPWELYQWFLKACVNQGKLIAYGISEEE